MPCIIIRPTKWLKHNKKPNHWQTTTNNIDTNTITNNNSTKYTTNYNLTNINPNTITNTKMDADNNTNNDNLLHSSNNIHHVRKNTNQQSNTSRLTRLIIQHTKNATLQHLTHITTNSITKDILTPHNCSLITHPQLHYKTSFSRHLIITNTTNSLEMSR